MVLMKDVSAALDTKCLVLSKLAELYARTDQYSYAKRMAAEGRRLSLDEDSVAWQERFQLLEVYINCAFDRAAEGLGAPDDHQFVRSMSLTSGRRACLGLLYCSPANRPEGPGCSAG
jgi:hypothetical protein